MAAAGFIVPYIFIQTPQLLLINASFIDLITIIPMAILGTAGVAMTVVGYAAAPLSFIERILTLIAGILLMDGKMLTGLAGIILLAAILTLNWYQSKHDTQPESKQDSEHHGQA